MWVPAPHGISITAGVASLRPAHGCHFTIGDISQFAALQPACECGLAFGSVVKLRHHMVMCGAAKLGVTILVSAVFDFIHHGVKVFHGHAGGNVVRAENKPTVLADDVEYAAHLSTNLVNSAVRNDVAVI